MSGTHQRESKNDMTYSQLKAYDKGEGISKKKLLKSYLGLQIQRSELSP